MTKVWLLFTLSSLALAQGVMVESPAFRGGRFSCPKAPPLLQVRSLPAQSRSLALVLYLKGKSPKPVWMVYDLPATTGAVREAGYIVIPYPGACRPGQYVLDMYALGVRRLPASSPSATKVRQALHRYMLGEGKLGGVYGR